MPVDDSDRVEHAQEKLKELRTRYKFTNFRARMGDFGVCQIQFRHYEQSWPHNWLDEDDVNKSHPELLRLFKDEICPSWSSFPPNAIVDETGNFRGLWSKVQKKHPLGASVAPEIAVKREVDIKPSLTPPPSASPPGISLDVEDEMGSTTGQPGPHGPTPTPAAQSMLYDPTLYPPTSPVVPKRGRARALDFDPIDDPPTKKRRVSPPPQLASTPAPPPPQPKKTTLFTANKSGPITRTRDGKFVPVPALPKPPRWGLNPEEGAEPGPEPLIVPDIGGEPSSRDWGSSTRTLDLGPVLNLDTPRSQPDTSISATDVHRVVDQNIELEDYEDYEGELRLGTGDSPQDTPAESISTSSWTRPSFLNMPRDGGDPDPRVDEPFVSLFLPPWLLVSLQSFKRTTTVTKGVSLTLRVTVLAHSNQVDARDRLETWTRRFRQTPEVQLWDLDDLPRLLPHSMKSQSFFHQLSVIDNAPDRECVVLQELGSYLEETSQLIIVTPSESRPDDLSINSTDGRNCRLFLFSPTSNIFPFDFGMQEHTLKDRLVCYYEAVDSFKFGVRDV